MLWAPGVVEVKDDEGQMGRFAFCFPSVLVEVEEVEMPFHILGLGVFKVPLM